MSGTYVKVRPYLVASNFSFFSSRVPVANSGPSGSSILYRDTNITRAARPSVSKNLRFQTCSTAFPGPNKKNRNILSSEARTGTYWDSMSINRSSRHKHTGAEWNKRITGPVPEESTRYERVWILPVTSCIQLSMMSIYIYIIM